MNDKNYNPYEQMLKVLDESAAMLGFKQEDYEIIMYPERNIPDVSTIAALITTPSSINNFSIRLFFLCLFKRKFLNILPALLSYNFC
jgi:hypothetical protein